MIAYDVIRFAGVLSIVVGLSLTLCAFMLPNKRGIVALTMVVCGALLILGGVVPDRTGKPLTQSYLARYITWN